MKKIDISKREQAQEWVRNINCADAHFRMMVALLDHGTEIHRAASNLDPIADFLRLTEEAHQHACLNRLAAAVDRAKGVIRPEHLLPDGEAKNIVLKHRKDDGIAGRIRSVRNRTISHRATDASNHSAYDDAKLRVGEIREYLDDMSVIAGALVAEYGFPRGYVGLVAEEGVARVVRAALIP